MELQDKIKKSADQLGVVLEIPAYVAPEKGFTNEKVITWENGDHVKILVDWIDGAFYYQAYIGLIDPKTNQITFMSGAIANTTSLESLVGMVDQFIQAIDAERTAKAQETATEPVEPLAVEPVADVLEPADLEPAVDAPVITTPDTIMLVPTDDGLVNDYLNVYGEYESMLLDPAHDHAKIREISEKLCGLEVKLREAGWRPAEILERR